MFNKSEGLLPDSTAAFVCATIPALFPFSTDSCNCSKMFFSIFIACSCIPEVFDLDSFCRFIALIYARSEASLFNKRSLASAQDVNNS